MFGHGRRDPWAYCFEHPPRIFDQHFGGGLRDAELFPAIAGPTTYALSHRPNRMHSHRESGISEVDCTKDKFVVKLDVQHFLPKEVSVKTVDNSVVIEGKHEEKQDDHGYVSRHFVRRYSLPKWAKAENVVCDLSSDGVLSVTAAKPAALAVEGKAEKVLLISSVEK